MRLLLAFFIVTVHFSLFAQELPPIQNFTPKDYNGEYQNWAISQSITKKIYVANHSTLLEFDGSKWYNYKLPNPSIIRSVKVSGEKIYTGSYREFGFWTKDVTGELQYTSLSEKLKDPLSEDEEFWDILKNERLMPHFHISVQAGNNLILKRMKRRHSREMAIDFCKKVLSIRQDATFGADIITGFPTETEEMFQDSIKLVDECNLTHLHVFPYSPRENTPASLMPQVLKSVVKDRAKRLRDKGLKNLKKHLKNKVGKKQFILVENNKNNFSIGKDQHFFKVKLNEEIIEGNLISCIFTGVENDILLAKRV